MKIAITGANGYIGSALVKKALDNHYDVIAIDIDNTYIDSRAKFLKINIFEENLNLYHIMNEPDVLIHCAWRNGFNHNSLLHIQDLYNHYSFIKAMSENVKYISVMGSMHEIGYYEGKVTENTPCNPQSLYGIAKNALRQSLELLSRDSEFYLHWLRAFYIIGNDKRSNSVFCKLLRKANEGEKEFPLNSGKLKYDFISLDELCEQILAASIQNNVNGIINICSGKPISLGEMIEEYIEENNLNIKLNYGVFPDRPYDSPIIYGDNSKIKSIVDKISNTYL